MKENEQTEPVDRFEIILQIVFLSLLGIATFIGGIVLLFAQMAFLFPLLIILILILEVFWIIIIKSWRPKNPQFQILRKVLFTVVFALLASILTFLCITWILSKFSW